MSTLKMITFLRPSGTTIELQNTKNMKAFAKANGFKIKKDQPKPDDLLSGDENGESGPSGESDTSGHNGAGE